MSGSGGCSGIRWMARVAFWWLSVRRVRAGLLLPPRACVPALAGDFLWWADRRPQVRRGGGSGRSFCAMLVLLLLFRRRCSVILGHLTWTLRFGA